jgi:hypothetical protein
MKFSSSKGSKNFPMSVEPSFTDEPAVISWSGALNSWQGKHYNPHGNPR